VRAAFDLVLDFHGGPRSAWLTWATGAPTRIGYRVPGRAWAYTTRVPWSRDLLPPRHSVLNQWALLASLGIPALTPAAFPASMPVDPSAASLLAARLLACHVTDEHALLVLHVSAGNPFRRWTPSSFAAVAAALAEDAPGRRIIVTSGPSDLEAATRVVREARTAAGPNAHRILQCGEFSLAELRALFDKAALFIGGDSGPLHIASTSRVPVVAIFGPTLPERSRPWRDPSIRTEIVELGPLPCRPCHQHHCVPGDFRCLTWITPETVIAAARRALKAT